MSTATTDVAANSQRELAHRVATVFDESPGDVGLLHGLVVKELESAFPAGLPSEEKVLAFIRPRVWMAIDDSPAYKAAVDRMVAKLEAHGGASTESHSVTNDSIALAVGAGLVIGTLIVGAVVLYMAMNE